MSEARLPSMTLAEFLPWHASQEGRFDFVDGQPVAMAGAKRKHDRIVVNIIVRLGGRIGRPGCELFTADVAVITPKGNARHPDVGIDCGRYEADSYQANAPTVVFEVLSESTRHIDLARKLDEYRGLETMAHVVLVDPERPEVVMWSRSANREWSSDLLEQMTDSLDLSAVGVTMTLAEIYDGVGFAPRLAVVSRATPPD